MPLPVSIGVVGGMGPWVDPLLLRKLLQFQARLGMRRDQEAIPVLLGQFAPLFEDRTEYLASEGSGENPAVAAARVAEALIEAGARVIGVPCNTFHAPAIYGRFEQEIAGLIRRRGVRLVHLIDATIEWISAAFPGARRAGILSTNGTYLHRIYSDRLAQRGFQPVTLAYEPRVFSSSEQAARRDAIAAERLAPLQNDVHHAVTSVEWGIKSGRRAADGYPAAKAVLAAAARRLAEAGAQIVILGCTEIPLALRESDLPDLPLADPLEALAEGLVEAWRAMFNPAWPAARKLPFPPA